MENLKREILSGGLSVERDRKKCGEKRSRKAQAY